MKYSRAISETENLASEPTTQFQLHWVALHRLRQEVARTRTPHIGIAGLLIGTDWYRSGQRQVNIQAVVPLTAERGADGGPVLNAEAARRFLEQHASSAREEARPLGFYRSGPRAEPQVTEQDVSFVHTHFGAAGLILLLDVSSGPATGTFFTVDELDKTRARACSHLILEQQPPGKAVQSRLRGHANAPAPMPAPATDSDGYSRDRTSGFWQTIQSQYRRPLFMCFAALVLLSLVALEAAKVMLNYRTVRLLDAQQRSVQSPSSALNLATEKASSGTEWRLTWNRRSDAIRSARGGRISITDGYLHRDIDLTAGELATGSIVYSPIADDVSFRLEVYDTRDGRAISESIRVLAAAAPLSIGAPRDIGTNAIEPPLEQQPPRASRKSTSRRRSRRTSESDEQSSASTETSPAAPPGALQPVVVSRKQNEPVPVAASAIDAPAQPLAEQASGSIPPNSSLDHSSQKAKDLGGNAASETAATLLKGVRKQFVASAATSGSEMPPADNSQTAPAAAPQHAPTEPAADPIARSQPVANGGQHAVGGDVHEAELIRRVEPVFPPAALQMRVGGDVRLQARIGKDGRTHDLRVISGPEVLRSAAIAAVGGWVYRPRTLNGRPVDAPIQIDVQFKLNGL